MNPPLAITGTGAVSPAGWGVPSLLDTLLSARRPPLSEIERPLGSGVVRTPALKVPADPSAVPKHPRLRRASPISRFAAAAALEALGPARLELSLAGKIHVGVILTLTNGCVNHTNRFFTEVLADPATASPILFPETVFNAPSSHLSALIGSRAPNDTLISDSTGIFTGIDLAAEWIARGEVDGCLVVAGDEIDWLTAEGLRLCSRRYLPAEGAAAVYLEAAHAPVAILELPDPVPFSFHTRLAAAYEIRSRLGPIPAHTLLVDGTAGIPRHDHPELTAWSDWQGPRWSPRRLLGEAMGASSALQIVAAAAALQARIAPTALVTAVGANQQAAAVLLSVES